MKKFLSLLLALTLFYSLTACGNSNEPKIETQDSIQATSDALGYELLALDEESNRLTYSSSSVIDGEIGEINYKSGNSAVKLRMTLEQSRFEGLAGYENAGKAGGVEAPSDVFSKLSIYVVDNSNFFCEFSFTNNGYTCYLSLAETKSNLDLYSMLLINYVNQLYNTEEVPDFVYTLNPDFGKEPETPVATTPAASTQPAKNGDASDSFSDTASSEEPDHAENATTDAQSTDSDSGDADNPDSQDTTDETAITLEYYDLTLVHPGDIYTFSPSGGSGSYTYESSDPSIATVDESGTVTAVGPGTATVTVTSDDSSVEARIHVKGE